MHNEVNDEEERLYHSEENDHAKKDTEQETVHVASKRSIVSKEF